jgi:hypothetical protein
MALYRSGGGRVRGYNRGGGMTALIVARGETPSGLSAGFGVNLIYNATFASELVGVDGWYDNGPGDIISWVGDDPIFGANSMKVAVGSDNGGIGAFTTVPFLNKPHNWQGDTLRCTFSYHGENVALTTYLTFASADPGTDIDSPWTGTATTTAQDASFDFVIPAGLVPSSVELQIVTGWDGGQDNVNYWLTNVKIVKLVDASP